MATVVMQMEVPVRPTTNVLAGLVLRVRLQRKAHPVMMVCYAPQAIHALSAVSASRVHH